MPRRRCVRSAGRAALVARLVAGLVAGFAALAPSAGAAQQWNSPAARALVERAVLRRDAGEADTSLRSYRTRAHGFVFFLAQLGSGLAEPPRLIKADELAVEVYWRFPDRSKQTILGWRDGAFLPYGINYHRDHLGIVTNNFGPLIRIGEGDEVRDVPHPLSPAGLALYDFALDDSLAVQSAGRMLEVYEVLVRPKDFTRALVVGTVFLTADAADLVRFRFSFTPAAYLDRDLEDLSVVLDNSVWDGRYWLPYRQEVEIRRRTKWLDFPARGIIRGRWEIDAYDLNVELPDALFAGPAIGGLRAARRSDPLFTESLDQAIAGVAPPLDRRDMAALRAEVERVAGTHALDGLPGRRLAANSASDVILVNRVQGLALGAGATFDLGTRRVQVKPSVAYGFADHRITGALAVTAAAGRTTVTLQADRRIRDFSDLPVISRALNSLTSQEAGDDHGDYVLQESLGATLRQPLGASGRLAAELGFAIQRTSSVTTEASPANGTYNANPPLGAGTYHVARLAVSRVAGGVARRQDLGGTLAVEAGDGPTQYLRATLATQTSTRLGATELRSRLNLGWGSDQMPAYRSFVLGGRGTLVGEPFRAFGGRTMALAQAEWRFNVPSPAISLGAFASTGRTMVLAPFVAAGWTDRAYGPTLPWRATPTVRPVAGLAVELLMGLIRLEAGMALESGEVGLTVDVHRDWWGIL